jgi:hypothetical protein
MFKMWFTGVLYLTSVETFIFTLVKNSQIWGTGLYLQGKCKNAVKRLRRREMRKG